MDPSQTDVPAPETAGPPDSARDFSEEVRLHGSPLVRRFLQAAGWLSLGLGFAGVFLPVLPTTPFLLLSAACFARSSPRFYNWLLNHRWFGAYIRNWRIHRAIPLRVKIIAIALIAIAIGFSAGFVVPLWPVKLLLVGIGLAVSVYILRIPTLRV